MPTLTTEKRARALSVWAVILALLTSLLNPFGVPAANASQISGSMSFSGSSYLSYPGGSHWHIASNEEFTIEWWQKMESGTASFPRVFSIGTWRAPISVSIEGGQFYFWMGQAFVTSFSFSQLNTWVHFSVSRKSGVIYIHQDGVLKTQTSSSHAHSDNNALVIGAETTSSTSSTGFKGRITNFRWIKGTGLYDASSYTPSTQQRTAVSGTQLLLNASSSGAVATDTSGNNRAASTSGLTWSSEAPAPAAPSVNSFTSSITSPTNATSIQYSLSFSESISGLSSADFQNAGTATGCSFSPSASSGASFTVTVTGCSVSGTLTPRLIANAVQNSSSISGPVAASTSSSNITLDRTAPVISFSQPSSPTRSNPIVVSLTSTETLVGLAASDFSAPGCTVSVSGISSPYSVSLSNCTDQATATLSFTGSVTDQAGNAAAAPAAVSVVVDRTFQPGSLTAPSTPTNLTVLPYTYTPGEALMAGHNLQASNISVTGTGCAVESGSISWSGTAYSFNVIGCQDGETVGVSMNSSTFQDVLGNSSPQISASNVSVDRSVAIGATIQPGNLNQNSSSISFTLNFNEVVSGLNSDELAITGASSGCRLTDFPEQNNFTSHTVTITGCEHGASVRLTLGANSVFDALGNYGPTTPIQTSVYTVDLVAPTLLSVTPRSLRQNSNTVIYDAVFSEPVTGVTSAMFSSASAGCGPAALTPVTGTSYVVTISGCSDGPVSLVANLTSAIEDAAGNTLDDLSAAASQTAQSVVVDTTAPTMSWQAAAAGPRNTQASYLLDFSEAIDFSSVSSADFSNAGSAPGCVFSVSQVDSDTVEITSTGCSDGTLTPVIAAGSVSDLAGNALSAGLSLGNRTAGSVTLDFTAPTVSVTATPSSPTNATSIAYQVTFNEPVTTPLASAFAMLGGVTGCTISITPNGANPTAVFDLTVASCSQGLAILTVNAYSNEDLAGNLGPSTAVTASAVTIDRTPAVADVTNQTSSPTNQNTLVFGISFNEPITGLVSDVNHFNLSGQGCSLGTLSGAQPGTSFTLSVLGCAASTQATLSLVAGSVVDAAGNSSPSSASPTASITTDRVPAAVLSFGVLEPNDNGLVVYELVFDEPVSGLTSSDLTVVGVTAGTPLLTAISPTRYEIEIQALGSGNAGLSLAANSVQDALGNLSPAMQVLSETEAISFASLSGAFTLQPTLNSAGKTTSNSLTWRIGLTRAINTSDATKTISVSDISFATGSCSSLSIAALSSSSFEVTASGCSDGAVTLEIAAGAAEDPDGNLWPSTSLLAAEVVVDTTTPAAAATAPSGTGQLVRHTFQFDFSEPVFGLTLDDFSLSAGVTATGCVLSYSATSSRALVTVSGCSNGTIGVTLASNSVIDEAGNIGPTAAVISPAITQATVAPQVVSVPPVTQEPPQLLATVPSSFVGPISQATQARLIAAGIVSSVQGVGQTALTADFTSLPSPTAAAIIVDQVAIQAGEAVAVEMVVHQSLIATHDVVGYINLGGEWLNLGTTEIDQSGVATTPVVFTQPGDYFLRIIAKPKTLQAQGFQSAMFSAFSLTDSYVMNLGDQALELSVQVQGQSLTLVQPVVSSSPIYGGPVITDTSARVPTTGGQVSYRGLNLSSISSAELLGVKLTVVSAASNSLTLAVPALEPGVYSLTLNSPFGKLTVQDALVVEEEIAIDLYQGPGSFVTKKISDTEIKVYAKDILGLGKVQFLVNGREIAWVRAVDATDPKLRLLTSNQAQVPYLVRTVSLKERVRIEIRVEGARAKFATYN